MRISADAEERVRTAAAQLHYRPNRVARNLRTSQTKTFGVISDFVVGSHFGSQMLTGLGAAARACDHLLVIGETGGDAEVEPRLIDEMLDRRVDGIIYTTLVTMELAVPPVLLEHPTVLLNCVDRKTGLPAVLPDDLGGGRAAAEVLLVSGRAAATFVVGEGPTPNALAGPHRLEGIEAAFAEFGLALSGVVPCAWTVTDSYAAVDAWLRDGSRPTALVCLNDLIAMGAYQALAHHALDVPTDVAVVAFDASDLAAWLRPPLTGLALPYAALGTKAVERLLAGDRLGSPAELVPMPVVAGGSVS